MSQRTPRRRSHQKRGPFPPAIAESLEHRLLLTSGPVAADTSPGTFYVTTAGDKGIGTLRQAIIDANNHPGPDIIDFNLSVLEIDVFSALPAVTDTTLIDGKSQPGY